MTSGSARGANLEVLVELVENEGHAVHEAVHICRFAITIPGVLI